MDNIISSNGLNRIGLAGLGTIGSKLAVYLASRHLHVTAYCHRHIEEHQNAIDSIIDKRFNGDSELAARLQLTNNLEDLCEAPLIIDATHESYDTKQSLYGRLKAGCLPETVLCSTTSSLDLNILAGYYRPGYFFGFHVFNPPDKMQLIELAYGENISSAGIKVIKELKQLLPDKVIIELPVIQGYVTNRLLFLYLNAAYNYHLSTGISMEKIDQCMKYGTNVPMGPFLLSDYIGTDICLEILEQFYIGLNLPEYRPSKLLTDLVAQGRLGRKTNQGFYAYDK